MARISGKLTAKALGWDRNTIGLAVSKVPQAGGRVLIGRIAGIVNGLHQTVNEDTGDVQTGLKGTFRGISSVKEEGSENPIVVTAGRCYLPGGLQEMVEAAYAEATKGDGNAKNTVNFALDLYAIPATNKAGYSYDGETLVDAATADPLAMLLDQAGGKSALPAPEDAPAEAPKGDEKAPEPEAAKAPAKGK